MKTQNSKFKVQNAVILFLIGLVFYGCITEYNPTGIEQLSDILVVEGIISDDETVITLSRSQGVMEYIGINYIDHARVYIDCDDGTQWTAGPSSHMGRYTIKNGTLNPERKYRLRFEIEEIDYDNCISSWIGFGCPTAIYEYTSDYLHPIRTPEIDSVFWTKRGRGQPVMINVATSSPNNSVMYYRWSYREDWEINSEFLTSSRPYYCWNTATNREMLLASAERTVFGRITDCIVEFDPWNRRFSVLYRIDVKQNAVSKRAFDYFSNIKKNSEQTGSIFAPVPSEMRGNITCTTDPARPVIGYVDVSSTTHKRRYIRPHEVYERPSSSCVLIHRDSLLAWNSFIPPNWVQTSNSVYYVEEICADCTFWGTLLRPDDWP